jgi:hypothetical protein
MQHRAMVPTQSRSGTHEPRSCRSRQQPRTLQKLRKSLWHSAFLIARLPMAINRVEARLLKALEDGPASAVRLASTAKIWLPGTLYPALMRLERRGAIVGLWADRPWPRVRVYRLVRQLDK